MKQGPFPSPAVVLSSGLQRYYGPLRHPPGRRRLPGAHRLYADKLHGFAARGPGRASPVPASTFCTFRSPDPGRFLGAALPGSSRRPSAFAVTLAARLLLFPFRVHSRGDRIHVKLRTEQLLPPKGLSTLGFGARRFPPTPPVCYPASWHLPGPDSHRLANASFSHSSPHIGVTPEIGARTPGTPWTVQRCSTAPGHSSRVAFQIPGAPSAMISAGAGMPRAARSRPKSSQSS